MTDVLDYYSPKVLTPDSRSVRAWVLGCIVTGTVLRLALSVISLGANDADIWHFIAQRVLSIGLLDAYRAEQAMNHPPLAVLWSVLCLKLGGNLWFTFLLKLPAIIGDALAISLLAKIWMIRGDVRGAKLVAIAMALSPIAIIISGYHCNTDDFYAYLSLLAMYFITDRRNFLLGGLALAAAINVKLIPVLLVPGAYSLCRSRRDAYRLTLGLAVGVIPFLPLLLFVWSAVKQNMLVYLPPESDWGIMVFIHDIIKEPQFNGAGEWLKDKYFLIGRWMIIVGVGGMCITSFLKRRWNGYEIGVLTYAMFLILAPGFGPQYTVILVPLLLTVSIARSWIYGVLVGMFLVLGYGSRLISTGLPLHTFFVRGSPTPTGSPFGLLAWGALLETACMIAFRSRRHEPVERKE